MNNLIKYIINNYHHWDKHGRVPTIYKYKYVKDITTYGKMSIYVQNICIFSCQSESSMRLSQPMRWQWGEMIYQDISHQKGPSLALLLNLTHNFSGETLLLRSAETEREVENWEVSIRMLGAENHNKNGWTPGNTKNIKLLFSTMRMAQPTVGWI